MALTSKQVVEWAFRSVTALIPILTVWAWSLSTDVRLLEARVESDKQSFVEKMEAVKLTHDKETQNLRTQLEKYSRRVEENAILLAKIEQQVSDTKDTVHEIKQILLRD